MEIHTDLRKMLIGGDLRSIAASDEVVKLVKSQAVFDELFSLLLTGDRLLTMRAADAIEKITRDASQYLRAYHAEVIAPSRQAHDKELKWHLALLLARLDMNADERQTVMDILHDWLFNGDESVIVRVNSLQTLHELGDDPEDIKEVLGNEMPPALRARLRKLI